MTITPDGISSTLQLPEGTADGETAAFVKPLTDLRHLPQSLLPLGLVLALIPLSRTGGTMPLLPEGTDTTLVDSFLAQTGLRLEGGKLIKEMPAVSPWASPSVNWALALSLAAFLRQGIKLSNPSIITESLPNYWTTYNSFPTPSPIRKPLEVTPTEAPRPVRRRVLASHTPESEMPDEIVYPDED